MTDFKTGDIVVLTSGSMRMAVETVDGGMVRCVWCHEGTIGRDSFSPELLRKWEERGDSDSSDSRGAGKGRPYKGPREGGGRAAGQDRPPPRGKPGWDGKPREKKYFRKD